MCRFLPLRLRLDSHDLVDPEVVEDIEERLLTLFEPGLPLKRTNNKNVQNRQTNLNGPTMMGPGENQNTSSH